MGAFSAHLNSQRPRKRRASRAGSGLEGVHDSMPHSSSDLSICQSAADKPKPCNQLFIWRTPMYSRSRPWIWTRTSGAILLAVLALTAVMIAQIDTGRIEGRIKDSSGAVVREAQVSLIGTDTGIAQSVSSTSTGACVSETGILLNNSDRCWVQTIPGDQNHSGYSKTQHDRYRAHAREASN